MPLWLPRPRGHMYCIAAGPTAVGALLFVVLYVRRSVPLFMEKMHLFFQILFTFGAFVQCFIMNAARVWLWLVYGVAHFALLAALVTDLFLIANERGCTFSCA